MNKSTNNVSTAPKKGGSKKSQPKVKRVNQSRPQRVTPIGRTQQVSVAQSRRITQSSPSIRMSGKGEICVVKHREYVQDLVGSTNYNVVSLPINPGLPALFLWLSSVAIRFESYRFRKLKFYYETESPTSQGGTILLGIDYDALDSPPVSKQQMMAYKSSVRAAPWSQCQLVADLLKDGEALPLRFVRSGTISTTNDLRLYDLGVFLMASQAAGGASGELYVEYEVELHTPNIAPGSGLEFQSSNLASQSQGAPFGTVPASVVVLGQGIGIILASDGTTFTFQQTGSYLMGLSIVGTVMSALTYSGTVTTPVQLIKTNEAVFDAAATALVGWLTFSVTSPGQTLKIALTATTVTNALADFAYYNLVAE